jgi:hypothetical protein
MRLITTSNRQVVPRGDGERRKTAALVSARLVMTATGRNNW